MGRIMLEQISDADLSQYLDELKLEPINSFSIKSKSSLVSEIDKAKKQGWYLLDQELEIGLRSLAAPIGTHVNDTYAAINVSVPASRVSVETLEREILPKLLRTAKQINHDISRLWPK